MSSTSFNSNNTKALDTQYVYQLNDGSVTPYWVPSSSKLSRGVKGTIQRVFTGEPLNNLCNVYIYNETYKTWFHEHTILGDPNRSGVVSYPDQMLTGNSNQTFNGITYTTSASINTVGGGLSGGGAFTGFGSVNAYVRWNSSNFVNGINTPTYPHNAPAGYVGTWVEGTYVGSNSLGGVSGEWLKLQLSTAIQPDKVSLETYAAWGNPRNITILGSNDDSNWTNLGNWSINMHLPGETVFHNLTLSNSYKYFGFVFTVRYTSGAYASIGTNDMYLSIQGLKFYKEYPSEDFGRSLDGTDNADMVAIGAPGTWFGSVSNITGYARVFTKDSSGNGWTQRGSQVSQTGGFGHSVALSPYDGNILVVGAPFYNTFYPVDPYYSGSNRIRTNVSEGKVYIYKWDGTNYTLQQTLNSPSGTLSNSILTDSWKSFYFGYSLGITDIGDKIIVGEPAIRNLWYTPDQLQGGAINDWSSTEFPYTGNAHVYDNFTVSSGGTTWTSNVSMTSIIGTTGIGTSLDLNPERVRWLDALGTSVDINRNGTRILAGAPGNYGTSNVTPIETYLSRSTHHMSGKIYTLEWDPIDAEWKEMGQISKHIVAPRGQMMIGMCTRFDGSGRRIVTGCPGFTEVVLFGATKNAPDVKGEILVYDWNGDQWVNFPGENIEIIDLAWNASDDWRNWQWKLGESVSIDGEGEMITFGVSEHKHPESSTGGIFRPNAFNITSVTYIGGATTSTAGSSSTVTTGSSNIWVYNIRQSMVVKGNVTVGGYIQATGMSIGTEDDSGTSSKSLFFGGSKSDNSYNLTVIENRVYDNDEKAELLLFKGAENVDPTTGGGTFGPDRIRLKGGQIAFDLNAGYDRIQEDICAVMHKNTGGAGMLGINVSAPTEAIHVDGKIKCTQGFIGKGREITGIDLNHVVNKGTKKFNDQTGITVSPIQLGEFTPGSITTFPPVAISWPSVFYSGYFINSSDDEQNAIKVFDNSTNTFWAPPGYGYDGSYSGTSEKIPGYKGEWVEIGSYTSGIGAIFVTQLEIYANASRLPRRLYMFGSDDGIEYDLIHDTGDKGTNWGTTGLNTVFTRTPDIITEDPYKRILIIVESGTGGFLPFKYIISGHSATLNLNMKIDNTGKLGIGTTSPNYNLDVVGDINFTGELSVNGDVGTYDQVLTSSGATTTWTNRVWNRLISLPSSTMTSSSSGGYTVSDSSNLGTGNEGWNAFDASSSTSWATSTNYLGSSTGSYYNGTTSTTYNGSLTVNGDWVQLQTPFSTVIYNKIDILPYSTGNEQCPRTGKLLGSNDGSTWSEIHSFTNQTYTQGQYTTISFTNTVAYSYFRLVCEDMNYVNSSINPRTGATIYYSSVITIAEIRFYGTSPNIYYNTGNVGIGTALPTYDLDVVGDINCTGTLSKGSGSFKIDHPLPNMSNTHYLYHSFIEGPRADLIYRGVVDLVNGSASVNLDTVSNMTDGTFEALNRNVQCFVSNETDWDALKGSVSGNILTILCQNTSSTAKVSWMVVGERKDKHMYDTDWTDNEGRVVPEKLK